jgi:predicted lipoprotein with Yx(FWY)xxD motif
MRNLVKLSLAAVATSLLLAACGSSSPSKTTSSASASVKPAAQTSGGSASSAVKAVSNPTLGTILTDSQGMTLYHLSGEQNGKFICTSAACLGVWHPLVATSGSASSSGVSSLGTVKRSNGMTQVTYKGTPLYTFAEDKQAGETKGQGIKDVGTWSAAKAGSTTAPSTASPPQSSSSSGSSGGGGGGGGGGGYAY